MTKSKGILAARRQWTNEEDRIIAEHYPHTPAKEVQQLLGCSIKALYSRASILNVKKTDEFLRGPHSGNIKKGEQRGVASQFKKGNPSWTTGKKIGTRGRSADTQFKPGQLSGRAAQLKKSIGSERMSRDGYLERKVNDDMPLYKRWKAVHIIEWEKVNGPLPSGHAVVFKDGNRQNIQTHNLELISRAELMRRNSVHNYGPEIASIHRLRGAITRQINKRSNQHVE